MLRILKNRINKYDVCRGFVIWKSKTLHIELWYCPRNFTIAPHIHGVQDIKLIYLWGLCEFFRQNLFTRKIDSAKVSFWKMFTVFSIKNYHVHWFSTGNTRPLIFINVATPVANAELVSASKDFITVNLNKI